jgi:DNA mismatch repair protein MutL
MSIKVLPEELISQIAAGEVVERPASAVKELVENSLDAAARHITIEVQGAGKRLIRVTDDGCGMTGEEVRLAIQRHSTSKISTLEDLFNIRTLGFRGEALPSIASVSRLDIIPNKSGEGLTVTVRDLFYNVPVRLKFLKSDSTELGQIADLVGRFILSRPQTALKLIVDGREVLNSSGNGNPKDAILAVYGLELAREMLEVSGDSVRGFVSKPNLSRIDRNYESFFVNGRYVKNFLLGRAVEEAYQSLIPGQRYPVAILFIEIPPRELDVNVHPTKREIKLLKTREVMETVYTAVRQALTSVLETGVSVTDPRPVSTGFDTGFVVATQPPTTRELEFLVTDIQPLMPVYQFLETYIIATDSVDLVLIDQHAAHERILFDRLSAKSQGTISQDLLIAETLELKPAQAAILEENLDYLKGMGFEIEPFGRAAYLVRAVPAVLRETPGSVLMDILDELKEVGRSSVGEEKQKAVLKLLACHAAIKAGDRLSMEEMRQLIRDLYKTQDPLTCPHGRPTMVKWTAEDLGKKFERR